MRDILPILYTGCDSDRHFFGCAHCSASHYILATLAFMYQYPIEKPPTARITQVDPAFEEVWGRRSARYEEILTLLPALLMPNAGVRKRYWMKVRYQRWEEDNRRYALAAPPVALSNAGKCDASDVQAEM